MAKIAGHLARSQDSRRETWSGGLAIVNEWHFGMYFPLFHQPEALVHTGQSSGNDAYSVRFERPCVDPFRNHVVKLRGDYNTKQKAVNLKLLR